MNLEVTIGAAPNMTFFWLTDPGSSSFFDMKNWRVLMVFFSHHIIWFQCGIKYIEIHENVMSFFFCYQEKHKKKGFDGGWSEAGHQGGESCGSWLLFADYYSYPVTSNCGRKRKRSYGKKLLSQESTPFFVPNSAYWQGKYKKEKVMFMKVFEGNFKVEPVYVDQERLCKKKLPKDQEEYKKCSGGEGKTASKLTINQYFEPYPPFNLPPLSWYIRGSTIKASKNLLIALQNTSKIIRIAKLPEDYEEFRAKMNSRSNANSIFY